MQELQEQSQAYRESGHTDQGKQAKKGPSQGELLLHCMFRLLQVVKIHQANNKLFADNVTSFRDLLTELWIDNPAVSFDLYRGRFYLNDERIVYTPSMWATSAKMTEYFTQRGLNGLTFKHREKLSDEEIVGFMDLFNRATRAENPAGWLEENATKDYPWVSFTVDEDKGLQVDEGGGGGEEPGGMGKTGILRAAPNSNKAYFARLTYSQALTALRGLVRRMSAGKAAGIQKSKRAVQELIDLLMEDEAVFLSLSTVRDAEDQLYTHSVNVTLLVLGMGQRLGFSRGVLEHLGLCGLFHDLGKVGEVEDILKSSQRIKGGDAEAKIQDHALASVMNIIRLNASHTLKHLILGPAGEHHMGVDRSGYPKVGDARVPLSLFGRMIAVADQYVALTSPRPWRPEPFSPHEALAKLLGQAGRQLDPVVIKVFVSLLGPWPPGSVLILDTHEVAISRYTPQSVQALPQARLIEMEPASGIFVGGDTIELAEVNVSTGGFKRKIISSIHPSLLNIQPVDYLLDIGK
ncbi:MAG: HD domain-containing protein [Deltaproteobacteria bacterium]|jgi:HD-GYP domain-containing protein (c-di-GMP phosphodiesterase class II)|nr:HD domain-containing protein [Deltaproteobacteria bacterium]